MKTKICTKCNKRKPLSKFYKSKFGKYGVYSICKKCCSKIYQKNKQKIQKRQTKYYKNFPWKYTLINIKARCNNVNHIYFKYYGGRGIKCLITEEELKKLWIRDKAWLLKQPSIDRIDNNGNYTYTNCQYIERIKNSSQNKRKPVLQFDKQGNFIKRWPSLTSAEKSLNLSSGYIGKCCKNIVKTAKGFIWHYAID